MSGSLFGIGLSGLRASQIALNATSSNISNVLTDGYSRQIASLSQANGGSAGGSFSGNGVTVTGVERQYQQYLNAQLNQATSTQSALSAQLGQATQIDNLLADSDAGINTRMQAFFAGLQTVADHPADTAARQSLLGNAESMSAQFRSMGGYLDNMGESITSQMRGAVDEANGYAAQIADLNDQIIQTTAKTGTAPNRLLDQRDSLVSQLGNLVDVSVVNQDGQFNVSLPGGQSLVSGNTASSLSVVASKADPTRSALVYNAPGGTAVELDESRITGGALGGLMTFRRETLEPASLKLDQLAQTLSSRVNAVHEQGVDLNGDQGKAFFTTVQPTAYANGNNTGDASLSVSFATLPGTDDFSASDVTASNYRVEVNADNSLKVTRLSDGQVIAAKDDNTTYDGMRLRFDGTAASGDSFLVKPIEGAASGMQVNISDPAAIAARVEDRGVGDNTNALAMAALQGEKVVNGNASFNSAYAQLVGSVGNQTATLKSNHEAQGQVTEELKSAQQSVSGVNLDEEAANLIRYQQLYSANAQVIRTASSMFDTLLGIMS